MSFYLVGIYNGDLRIGFKRYSKVVKRAANATIFQHPHRAKAALPHAQKVWPEYTFKIEPWKENKDVICEP